MNPPVTLQEVCNARDDMVAALTSAINAAGFSVSGPTDHRAAENGEPVWVCNARAALAAAAMHHPELNEGEKYAGILLGKDGNPDHHLVLLPGQAESVSWGDAKDWAESIGGELPSRREQALLYANLPEEFQPRWHWSGEEHAALPGYAWMQYFGNGTQNGGRKGDEYRARAIRRLKI